MIQIFRNYYKHKKFHILVDFSFIKEYVAFQVEEMGVIIGFLFAFQRLVPKVCQFLLFLH